MANIDDFKANLIGGGARANQFRVTITPPPGIAIGLDALAPGLIVLALVPAELGRRHGLHVDQLHLVLPVVRGRRSWLLSLQLSHPQLDAKRRQLLLGVLRVVVKLELQGLALLEALPEERLEVADRVCVLDRDVVLP